MSNPKITASLKKANVSSSVLGSEAKPSFLTNHRVYTKLTTGDDLLWAIRALGAASLEFSSPNLPASFGTSWAQAVIFMITSTSVPHLVQQKANKMLQETWKAHPNEVSAFIADGMWLWLKSLDLEEKDSPATSGKTEKDRLHLVFNAMCSASPDLAAGAQEVNGAATDMKDHLCKLLIRLVVLCRQPLLSRVRWIDLCLQCELDPRTVVMADAQAFMDEVTRRALVNIMSIHTNAHGILMYTLLQHKGDAYLDKVHLAACNAAAELAFVAPETVMPLLVDLFSNDLDPSQLVNIGPTEAAIYRTPEGTAFVDVLSQKPQTQMPSKNTKDYDMLRWEQELREQLAEKQGKTQKKLTADEQTKVKSQLAKEATIRNEVRAVVERLQRGFGIVSSLAMGPPTDATAWTGPAVQNVFNAIKEGAGLLVGYQAAQTYLDCSLQVSSRLGSLRQFIGVATLRAQGVSQLPPEYEAEPLGGT